MSAVWVSRNRAYDRNSVNDPKRPHWVNAFPPLSQELDLALSWAVRALIHARRRLLCVCYW
jgi:hypothetical protein